MTNHGYNQPNQGDPDWHVPLNENFQSLESDVEIRDSGAPGANGYSALAGAKYLDEDSGDVYLVDGGAWTRIGSIDVTEPGRYLQSDTQLNFVGPAEWSNSGYSGNIIGGNSATVAGGSGNEASGDESFVAGGSQNEAVGHGSFAAGRYAKATHDGSYVFGDQSTTEAQSVRQNQALFQTSVRVPDFEVEGHLYFRNFLSSGAGFEEGAWRVHEYLDELQFERHDGSDTDQWIDSVWFTATGDVNAAGAKNFVETVETVDGSREVCYTATEAGQALTETVGVATLENGRADISLPNHFGWVTSDTEPLHVQTTPYTTETSGLAVVERTTNHIVVEDIDGTGDYEFSYTVKGTRAGYEDKKVVSEPSTETQTVSNSETPADD